MPNRERVEKAVEKLDEWGYKDPRIEKGNLRVGEERNDIISIPLDNIEEIDLPSDGQYTDWVKLHLENQVEALVDMFDIDTPDMGARMFKRFVSTGSYKITFHDDERFENGQINIEQSNVWSTDYTAYRE